ncbi:RNA-binding-containing protein [Coleophoma cylindrospora]|uniref:RNA-binding-containing protein n=1 Tax=Coleophoma cylindrospora TaxID=1849047 RepID=A0A3D8QK00_9HELO|nr:RNA-binding-containing protein [Coleophoma cylindrospora]
MNSIRQIQELNKRELENGVSPEASWHTDYRDTAYIYIGGLPFELSEGDIITIFSQFGEPTYINLIRDKETGKSKGFAFLKYEDQRSTDLAVDNLGGAVIMGRTLKVDHTRYKKKDDEPDEGINLDDLKQIEDDSDSRRKRRRTESESEEERPMIKEEKELAALIRDHDDDDPMKAFLIEEKKEEITLALTRIKGCERPEKDRRHRHHHRSRRAREEDKDGEDRRYAQHTKDGRQKRSSSRDNGPEHGYRSRRDKKEHVDRSRHHDPKRGDSRNGDWSGNEFDRNRERRRRDSSNERSSILGR